MKGTEEVGMAISDFGAEGNRRQDVRDILQGVGSSSATVWIKEMGNDPTNRQDDGRISSSSGLQDDRQKTAEGHIWELEATHYG